MEQPREPGPLRWTRTSLIVEPSHGQIPPYTEELLDRVEAREAARAHRGEADNWEDRNLNERCMRPQAATGLQGTVRIIQAPGWVAILPDGLQYPQLLRIGDDEQVSSRITGWFGRSRARWEGDKLVIETTNFNNKQDGGPVLPSRRPLAFFLGSGETLRRVETYERLGPDQMAYGLTTDDPSVYVGAVHDAPSHDAGQRFPDAAVGAATRATTACRLFLSAARADEEYAMRAAQEAAELRKPEIAALRERTAEWLGTGAVRAPDAPVEEVNPDR